MACLFGAPWRVSVHLARAVCFCRVDLQRGPNGEYLPLYDGVRSANFAWWRYEDGFEEMYDLGSDPYELTNIASDPAYASTRALMIAEWNRLKNCKGTSCQKPSIAP